MMKLGFDIMGGDHAPQETIKGAIESLEVMEGTLVLYGDRQAIERELAQYEYDASRIEIVATTQIIENDDKPVKAMKQKPDSSMMRGLNDLKERRINGFISGGNTGAILAGGIFKVGRIRGIKRPAICSIYPTGDRPAFISDAGANAECKPNDLLGFARMSSIYAEKVFDIPSPRVGLINLGVEETKGTTLQQEAHRLLQNSSLNFIGNIEGRDIPKSMADVLIADGFTGNIVLKLTEGVAMTLLQQMKEAITSSIIGTLGGAMIRKNMKALKRKMDYTEYGGAPILGIDGLVVKAHGSSNAKAFKNAILYAYLASSRQVVDAIKKDFECS